VLASFHQSGGGDAVADVALSIPLRVLTKIVGFSPATVARFRELTEARDGRVPASRPRSACRGRRPRHRRAPRPSARRLPHLATRCRSRRTPDRHRRNTLGAVDSCRRRP
jgi:cytochrome P450